MVQIIQARKTIMQPGLLAIRGPKERPDQWALQVREVHKAPQVAAPAAVPAVLQDLAEAGELPVCAEPQAIVAQVADKMFFVLDQLGSPQMNF